VVAPILPLWYWNPIAFVNFLVFLQKKEQNKSKKKYHIAGTVLKIQSQIIERGKIDPR
jgi:hypothetical protein